MHQGNILFVLKVIYLNKKQVLFGFFLFLACITLTLAPIFATESPCGWATLPITDPEDDVFMYTMGDYPWEGVKGAYHPELDIVSISISGVDIVTTFAANPIIGGNYQYSFYIDLDANDVADYVTSTGSATGTLYLKRVQDGFYWNGSGWDIIQNKAPLTVSTNGNDLSWQDLDEPIPAFASARFALGAGYIGEYPTVYTDFTPQDPINTTIIPGFLFITMLFGLLALFGLVFLLKKDEFLP